MTTQPRKRKLTKAQTRVLETLADGEWHLAGAKTGGSALKVHSSTARSLTQMSPRLAEHNARLHAYKITNAGLQVLGITPEKGDESMFDSQEVREAVLGRIDTLEGVLEDMLRLTHFLHNDHFDVVRARAQTLLNDDTWLDAIENAAIRKRYLQAKADAAAGVQAKTYSVAEVMAMFDGEDDDATIPL